MRIRAQERLLAIKFAPIGKPAGEIKGVDLNGRPMQLSQHRGKIVLVSFWAEWCFPSIKMIPHKRQLAKRLKGRPFVIVGVNGDNDTRAAARAVKKHRIAWPSFRDKRPGKTEISGVWNALYPTLYLIDHKGIIRKRWTGTPSAKELSRTVLELVKAAETK